MNAISKHNGAIIAGIVSQHLKSLRDSAPFVIPHNRAKRSYNLTAAGTIDKRKITKHPERDAEIVAMRDTGVSVEAIADQYGMQYKRVIEICARAGK